ncbi:KAP family P-loop NTPase fold protein [Blastococcus sp. SYSU DS0617]
MAAIRMSDEAIDGNGTEDQLDRQLFARQLAVTLNAVRRQAESGVLAVIGSWGSGKTSVLNMTMTELQNGPWAIAEFNPWLYPNESELQNGFFAELRAAMEGEAWSESRRQVGALGRALSPLGKLTTLAALPDASDFLKAIAGQVEGDTSASKTKTMAEKALREAGRPILVVMDDLDRLTPDELLLTFKLVRLVGNLPNVYYLLSYDERTLLDVLSATSLVGKGDKSRASDYLEKIVQVRLDLPHFRQHQKDALVNVRFAALLDQLNLVDRVEVSRVSTAYRAHLSHRLQTPRSVNRFFAQVAATFPTESAAELDFVDFFLITWLRTSEPRLYSMLAPWKSELTGGSIRNPYSALAGAMGGKPSTREEKLQLWRHRLETSGVHTDNIGGVLEILGQLFVPLRALIGNSSDNAAAYRDVGRRQGVGHSDYFDRYFAYGVPSEDVPDSLISAVIIENTEHNLLGFGEQTKALFELPVDDTALVIRKFVTRFDEAPPRIGLLWPFSVLYARMERQGGLGDPSELLVELAAAGLRAGIGEDVLAFFEQMLQVDNEVSVLFLARALQEISHKSEREDRELPSWFESASERLRQAIRDLFSASSFDDVTVMSRDQMMLVWAWGELEPDDRKSWLREQVTSGRWTVVELFAALQQGSGIYGATGLIPTVGDVHLSKFEDYIGLDFALDNARESLEEFELVSIDSHRTEPTFADRRNAVASALKRELLERQ